MAYRVGVCTGHYEFIEMLRRFAKGVATAGMEATGSGSGNTGGGTLGGERVTVNGGDETWTISCNNADTIGAETWTVTGSTTGALTDFATTGVQYEQNDIAFLITASGANFIVGDGFSVVGYEANAGNTGDGTMSGIDPTPTGVSETITVTCTSIAGGTGNEAWSVTGGTSGAHDAATTGVAYTDTTATGVSFLITAGATAFAVSDSFTFAVVVGELVTAGAEWVEERYVDNVLDGESLQDLELIMRGPGLSGTESIYAAFTTNQSITADYYNISVSTMIGYVSGDALAVQPSYSGERWIPMWNAPLRYWVCINGQRIVFAVDVEKNYWSGYVGKFLPYATPSQFPYPICVMGTNAASTERYSETHTVDIFNGCMTRLVTNVWASIYNWPLSENWSWNARNYVPRATTDFPYRDTEGDYPLMPLVLTDTGTYGALGDLDGIYYVPGFNSAAENVVQADGFDHVKIANGKADGFNSYFALRLE